ncbi:plasmid partitioning/stability family protein [Proteus mirabilis]|uniref:plasmid partitioning/stability family protein n=1 Tax=Proteus mirabilis TaxID=584 RepID=UPI0034D5341C
MSDDRKKVITHIHPNDSVEDKYADELISSQSRNKGDFLRKCLLSGLALHKADPRLPNMISCLLDDNFDIKQLSNILSLIDNDTLQKVSKPIEEKKEKKDKEIKNNDLDNAKSNLLIS